MSAGDDRVIDLPASAQPAWLAYAGMLRSKGEYFALLTQLERREAALAGRRPLAETARLAALLEAHTQAVATFRAALNGLAAADPAAHAALISALGRVNARLGTASSEGPH